MDYALRTTVRYIIKPTARFYNVGYFLGYNMVGSFLISMFVPVVTLSVLNSLIWRRLRFIWRSRGRLGVREKRNTRAALSLVLVVLLFFVCHSMKLVVSGYQVRGGGETPDPASRSTFRSGLHLATLLDFYRTFCKNFSRN